MERVIITILLLFTVTSVFVRSVKHFSAITQSRIWAVLNLVTWTGLIVAVNDGTGIVPVMIRADDDAIYSIYGPMFWIGVCFVMIASSITKLVQSFRGPPFWNDAEIVQLRQIAATGWIVLPDTDGDGYWAYGPEGQREWLDHWVDVEERFLCTS